MLIPGFVSDWCFVLCFLFLLWISGKYGVCVLPGGKFSVDLIGVVTGALGVSEYWEQTLKNGDRPCY